MTYILGVETSCDETAVSVVENGERVLSNIVRTQTSHAIYGGVVPDLSSREHVDFIYQIADTAMKEAGFDMESIDAVAAVNGPGLVGSLMTGLMFAKGAAIRYSKKLIAVNHVMSHIYGNNLTYGKIEYPLAALVVSGGHTSIFFVENPLNIREMGHTLDDAAGEAFDKCAKLLKLGYPGGPAMQKAAEEGDPKFFRFPRSKLESYNFSFSGLKTAVLYYSKKQQQSFLEDNLGSIAASVQEAIVDQLVERMQKLVYEKGVKRIALAGGVSANGRLRIKMRNFAEKQGLTLYIPEIKYCTDNAAMVAGIAYHSYIKEDFADMSVGVFSR